MYSLVHISFELMGIEEPLDADVRVTFGLRRTREGWRFIHCHESRQLIRDDTANTCFGRNAPKESDGH